jgi:RNA polymerase sigma-70 factor (ECF subfamily)
VSSSDAAEVSVYADDVGSRLIARQARTTVNSVHEPDDETLLLRIQAVDMEALGLLFQRYARLILAIARNIVRDDAEAEDVVQDVFLFLAFKSKLFNPSKGSARSWLLQVTYHRAYDHRRYLCTRSFYDRPDDHNAAEALMAARGIENPEDFFAWQSLLQPAFEELTEDQQETLTLHFYEGYTLREIAEKLGQSFGNVQHHFYRGIERLRKHVFNNHGE